ncbi:MAG: hypothetical protein Tsb0021_13290 [Chlamydiales bacterium]
MQLDTPKTIIWRHQKENKKKCTLEKLRGREDFKFYSYPKDPLPSLESMVCLTLNAPPLTREDRDCHLLLIDATWRYAEVMERVAFATVPLIPRSLPPECQTAYPRRQNDCTDPSRGLASIEALYVAYSILGWNTDRLLDHYLWKERFLQLYRESKRES